MDRDGTNLGLRTGKPSTVPGAEAKQHRTVPHSPGGSHNRVCGLLKSICPREDSFGESFLDVVGVDFAV